MTEISTIFAAMLPCRRRLERFDRGSIDPYLGWGQGMSKVPSANYDRVIAALVRLGFVVVRQRGSHIRLQRNHLGETILITVPAHRPIKRSTLAHIIKQAQVSLDDFIAAM